MRLSRLVRCFLATALLCFAGLALGQTATVSGTLTNASSGGVGTNAYLKVELYGCGGNRAIWSGGVITQAFNYVTDANGAISGTIVRNDQITCGNDVGNATSYFMQPFVNGSSSGPKTQFRITGSSFNWNSATPITVNPVVPAPTGDGTYCRLDGGNCDLNNSAHSLATTTGTFSGKAKAQQVGTGYYYAEQMSITCDGTTDDTTAFNAALTTINTAGGGTLFLPNKTCLLAGQVTVPNDGATPPTQNAIRIVGVVGGGLEQGFTQSCKGGTILNMTFNATTAKITTLGLGKLEITGICFKDTATDFKPLLIDTLTNLHFHHNQFQGNTTHFASPPTQNGQDGIILGGTGVATGTGAVTDYFQGYGTSIDHNQFDYCGRAVLIQNQANSVHVEFNEFFNHCTNLTDAPITLNPGTGGGQQLRGVVIVGNLVEMGASKYAIRLVQNVIGGHFAFNSFWDANIGGGGVSVNGYKEEAAASNTQNQFISAWQDNNSTPVPDSITANSSRIFLGRYLAPVGTTDCSKPMFGASSSDTVGIEITGGAVEICSGSVINEIFNSSNFGEFSTGVGGSIGFQATTNPVPGVANSVRWTIGAGVPSAGSCTAANGGSIFSRTDGTPTTTLYVCDNSTHVWTAK